MTIPHISWKRLSAEELKHHYETTEEEFSRMQKRAIFALVNLVKKGDAIAFLSPEGELRYQYWNPLLKDGR